MKHMKSAIKNSSAARNELTFCVPTDVSFADLNLRWSGGGVIFFDWFPLERLCESSSIDPELIRNSGPANVGKLINYWYIVHRLNGGEPDAVKEEAMSLVATGDWGEIQFVHAPGHA